MASASDDDDPTAATVTVPNEVRQAVLAAVGPSPSEIPSVADDADLEIDPTTVQAHPPEMSQSALGSLVPSTEKPSAAAKPAAPPPGPALPKLGAPSPADGYSEVSIITSTDTNTVPGRALSALPPRTIPRNVDIREAPSSEDPLEETEVRTLVTRDPPPSSVGSGAVVPAPESTSAIGAGRSSGSITRQPMLRLTPASGDAASRRNALAGLPELASDDDPNEDDAYEADESVTMRGAPRDHSSLAPSGAKPAHYEDDQDEKADDAESVTTKAPKHLADAARGIATSGDDNENTTAVMPAGAPPAKARPATEPMVQPPANHSSSSNQAAWVLSARPPAPASESALRMAPPDAAPSVDRASLGALVPPGYVPRPELGSDAHRVVPPEAMMAPGYQNMAGPSVMSGPYPSPSMLASPPATKPSYGVLVLVVAALSFAIPLALFFVLTRGSGLPPSAPASEPRAPAEVAGDPVGLSIPPRQKAKASASPAPSPSASPSASASALRPRRR